MRIPGFKPNYHNTAANRAVNWSTPNNPVNNTSVLFQLRNFEIQASELKKQSLKSSSRMFTDVTPLTVLQGGLGWGSLEGTLLTQCLSTIELFQHRLATERPSHLNLFGWNSLEGMAIRPIRQFLSSAEMFSTTFVTGEQIPLSDLFGRDSRSDLLGWNTLAGDCASSMYGLFGIPSKPGQDDK